MTGMLQMDQLQSLVDMCDPEGAAQRDWEDTRASGKRVTGFSGSVAGQEPAAAPAGSLVTPAGVGPQEKAKKDTDAVRFTNETRRKRIPVDEADIWDDDEVDACAVAAYDSRERPEYTFLYKQKIGANDVYLGLDYEKDPSSASCEELLLRVDMPKDASAQETHLDVKADSVDLRSANYRLVLPLPKKVLTGRGSAKWEKDKHRMVITLVVDREAEGLVTKII